MNKMTKHGIVGLILILAVGFAAVATNLIINGQANINANTDDFDIYFTEASTDEGGTAEIDPSNNKEITYVTKKLSFVGNSSTLDYTVYNNSSQYDANVDIAFNAVNTVDGVDYSSYYTVSFEGFDPTTSEHTTSLPAKTSKDGSITITLTKPLLKEVQIEFTLTLVPSATERTETAVVEPKYEIVSGDLDTVGSVVKIADEEFYVIGQEDADHVKLLSKYNLNVGNNIQPGTEGIQNSLAIGYNSDGSTVVDRYFPATVPFSSTNYWYDGSNLKSDYGTSYPTYVYDDNASVKTYVDDYVEYLETQGVNVTGRLISQEELVSLGCDASSYSCSSSPAWVYQTSFWSGSVYSTSGVWVVSNGVFIGNYYYFDDYLGVRPVITVSKTIFE